MIGCGLGVATGGLRSALPNEHSERGRAHRGDEPRGQVDDDNYRQLRRARHRGAARSTRTPAFGGVVVVVMLLLPMIVWGWRAATLRLQRVQG